MIIKRRCKAAAPSVIYTNIAAIESFIAPSNRNNVKIVGPKIKRGASHRLDPKKRQPEVSYFPRQKKRKKKAVALCIFHHFGIDYLCFLNNTLHGG